MEQGSHTRETPLLELKRVSKTFGGLLAVDRVSFEVKKGELLAIIGPNGAGKTTLFNVISGLLPVSSGEIWFEQQRIDTLPPHRMASLGIARTFQLKLLFSDMSAIENVMVGHHSRTHAGILSSGLRLPGARAEEQNSVEVAMERLALVGLEEKAHLPASSLSSGEQKLLGLARALAVEPKLLLLDEPAAGLSAHEREELSQVVLSIRDSGVTVLLVEHIMELVMGIAERVMVLNYGQQIAFGTPAEVQSNDQVKAAYLGEEA